MMSDVVDKGAPFEMLGLDHVVLRIRDLEKMRAFYCDVLGCTFEDHDTDLGLYQVRAGNQLIDLVPVSGKAGSAGGAEGEGPAIYIKDPEGNTVELKGPADPSFNEFAGKPFETVRDSLA
jgi:catechol 2,3-dioxygenase-like lactoylglutathione lyase family enzyme